MTEAFSEPAEYDMKECPVGKIFLDLSWTMYMYLYLYFFYFNNKAKY
jgi:hypothetical protein